ncbi:MAG: PIN domain-containing protein [Proteobacteria bacterium]|nr:PIN domain-containing protein [Pseudomonadota bacterium]
MKQLFLDTGYVIALEAADDQHHEEAIKHWRGLLRKVPNLVTTTYVVNEIATFFNSRNRHAKAVEIINRLKSSSSVQIVHVSEKLFDASWEYFKKHSDKMYSLTDCASFVTMEEMKIEAALAFDQHFIQAGFKKLP